MAQQFYTILTNTGKAKLANANVFGRKINLTTLVVGDSNGNYYNPTEDQEKLVNEVWRGNIQLISVDEKNPNWIKIETVIPSDVGSFTIREVGALDDEGNLILIAKYPETYKPVIDDGATKELKIRTILEVSNAENVTLKIKSNLITATMEDIDNLNKKINNLDGKAVRLRNHIVLSQDTTKIPIGISQFNVNDDIEVFINGRFLSKNINYKIAESNTEIENIDSNILWQTGDEIDICVNKNVKNEVNAKDYIDVGLIPEGSITENKLNPQFVNKVNKIQEDLANIDLAANKVKLNKISGINATEVQGAIQELFTNADNAQKGISNVIGSPLSASDTLTTQKDKIQTLKNTFASNLIAKGQSSSGSESLNSLIGKVLNAGKKIVETEWFIDSKTIEIKYHDSTPGVVYFRHNVSLDFNPSKIIFMVYDSSVESICFSSGASSFYVDRLVAIHDKSSCYHVSGSNSHRIEITVDSRSARMELKPDFANNQAQKYKFDKYKFIFVE